MHITLAGIIGDRFVWDFGPLGLSTNGPGVTNGIGVIVATGTGQALDSHIVWAEQD
jgi:hypothetical protein